MMVYLVFKERGRGCEFVSPFNVRDCAAALSSAHQKLEIFVFEEGMLNLFLFLSFWGLRGERRFAQREFRDFGRNRDDGVNFGVLLCFPWLNS